MSSHSLEGCPDESNSGDIRAAPAAAKSLPDGLACNGCRKAKLRCSRDKPSCLHCRKTGLECMYETKRVKPGLKAGAVENLHRRLDALERIVHEREARSASNSKSTQSEDVSNHHESAAYNILALLAKELPKLVNASRDSQSPIFVSDESIGGNCKRRRMENGEAEVRPLEIDLSPELPGSDLLGAITTAYFCQVHPWIPMIHQGRFRQRMDEEIERPKLNVILHAMVIAAFKFVPNAAISADLVARTRKWIVWTAMDNLALESLQALIILAFTDIGSGNAAKAWSIIGSLTRTVEYSQLAQEHEAHDHHPFCQPYDPLSYTSNWTEIEERRRVFWNVFNLDRFCSVTMGWNTSLTSDDVHRRLPCDGHLWRKQQPVVTPYFGIWDKAAGRIGNPIGFLPHYSSPGQVNDIDLQPQPDTASTAGVNTAQNFQLTDMSTVGAFAYCIEATESMSRVMSYFLQQNINLHDQREISSWLTRFKELDLRLVHWKMLLPQKWKSNPNMTRQVPLMDPNLTMAHVTHNASMILLHQPIAYPPKSWGFRSRLPSSCSAEACYSAGIEIATITENYLSNSQKGSPIGSQYAFCVFIAARMLLVHWRYATGNELPQEFWSLVHSLEEVSRRWNAYSEPFPGQMDLSAKYAARLNELYELCTMDETFQISVTDYTNEVDHSHDCVSSDSGRLKHRLPLISKNVVREPELQPELTQWPAQTPAIANSVSGMNVDLSNGNTLDTGDFTTIPQMMLDHRFMNMDRVIAFDDGSMFAATMDHGPW